MLNINIIITLINKGPRNSLIFFYGDGGQTRSFIDLRMQRCRERDRQTENTP